MNGVIDSMAEHNENQSQAADALGGLSQRLRPWWNVPRRTELIQQSLESLDVTSNSIHDRNQSNLALTRETLEAYQADIWRYG